jgi:hypothetical protein
MGGMRKFFGLIACLLGIVPLGIWLGGWAYLFHKHGWRGAIEDTFQSWPGTIMMAAWFIAGAVFLVLGLSLLDERPRPA